MQELLREPSEAAKRSPNGPVASATAHEFPRPDQRLPHLLNEERSAERRSLRKGISEEGLWLGS